MKISTTLRTHNSRRELIIFQLTQTVFYLSRWLLTIATGWPAILTALIVLILVGEGWFLDNQRVVIAHPTQHSVNIHHAQLWTHQTVMSALHWETHTNYTIHVFVNIFSKKMFYFMILNMSHLSKDPKVKQVYNRLHIYPLCKYKSRVEKVKSVCFRS